MNKKGVSGVITTMIIISISLVAVGIVYVVITNILDQSSEKVEVGVSRLFSSCSELGYEKMLEGWNCYGEIIYAGGGECCDGDAKSDKELLESLGAISWWRFEGNANDEIGGNDGTLNGGIECDVEGNFGKGCYFEANLDHIGLPTSTLTGLRNYTVSFWVKSVNVTKEINTILHGTKSGANDFSIEFEDDRIDHIILNRAYSWTGASHKNNIWYSVVITRGGEICKIYEGGNLKISVNCAPTIVNLSNGKLVFGEEQDERYLFDPNQALEGILDEPMIFNRALSEDEVRLLYELDLS